MTYILGIVVQNILTIVFHTIKEWWYILIKECLFKN